MVHIVANKNTDKEFILPVTWQVFSRIKVQAESLDEAFNWARNHIDEIPLDSDTDYVDGSYEISAESPEECEIYNRSNT